MEIAHKVLLAAVCYVLMTPSNALECSSVRKAVYCDGASGSFLPRPPNNVGTLYIADCNLSALTSEDFARFSAVKTLHIENSHSSSNIPISLLSHLTNLEKLQIANSPVFSSLGHMLSNKQQLKYLEFNNNSLRELDELYFKHLQILEVIDLRNNQISEINMYHHGLFFYNPAVRVVILRQNNISLLQKQIFTDLENLTMLDISGNEIANIDNGAFNLSGGSGMVLNLSRNQLSRIGEQTFALCGAVISLDISNNQIIDLHPGAFQGLPNVQVMNISGNKLEEVTPAIFSRLMALGELDLSFNRLKTLLSDQFSASASLSVLRLSANAISVINSKTFRHLASLEELYLDDNGLTEFGDAFSVTLPKLSYFSAAKNYVDALQWGTFRGCSGLKGLDLSENSISEIESCVFSNNTSLEYLFLNKNNITEIICSSFAGLDALLSLDLSGNNLRTIPSFHYLKSLRNLTLQIQDLNSCHCFRLKQLKNTRVNLHLGYGNIHDLCSVESQCGNNLSDPICYEKECTYERKNPFGNQPSSLSMNEAWVMSEENRTLSLAITDAIKSSTAHAISYHATDLSYEFVTEFKGLNNILENDEQQKNEYYTQHSEHQSETRNVQKDSPSSMYPGSANTKQIMEDMSITMKQVEQIHQRENYEQNEKLVKDKLQENIEQRNATELKMKTQAEQENKLTGTRIQTIHQKDVHNEETTFKSFTPGEELPYQMKNTGQSGNKVTDEQNGSNKKDKQHEQLYSSSPRNGRNEYYIYPLHDDVKKQLIREILKELNNSEIEQQQQSKKGHQTTRRSYSIPVYTFIFIVIIVGTIISVAIFGFLINVAFRKWRYRRHIYEIPITETLQNLELSLLS